MRGQRHAPAALYPGKDPVPIVQEAGWAPGPVWTNAENLAPPPEFDTRTVQPVASRYNDCATRPAYLRKKLVNLSFCAQCYWRHSITKGKIDGVYSARARDRCVHGGSVRKHEGKGLFERPKCRWENYILIQVWVELSYLIRHRGYWLSLLITEPKSWVA